MSQDVLRQIQGLQGCREPHSGRFAFFFPPSHNHGSEKMGPSNSSYLLNIAIFTHFHFHGYGRKSREFEEETVERTAGCRCSREQAGFLCLMWREWFFCVVKKIAPVSKGQLILYLSLPSRSSRVKFGAVLFQQTPRVC